MPLCISKRNFGSDIPQWVFAIENSGTEDAIALPITHQAGLWLWLSMNQAPQSLDS